MSGAETSSSVDRNQHDLAQELERIRGLLQTRSPSGGEEHRDDSRVRPAALESLCAAFNLSPFERDVLLLCTGSELDVRFAALLSGADGNSGRGTPTFSIALAALPDAHWSALAPTGPLRHWRLVEVGAGESLTTSPLRIDERVLHFLVGVATTDERVECLVRELPVPELLPESHRCAVERVAAVLRESGDRSRLPALIQFSGDVAGQRAVAAASAAAVGLRLAALHPCDLPASAAERETLARLLEREAVLGRRAFFIEAHDRDPAENDRAAALAPVSYTHLTLPTKRIV